MLAHIAGEDVLKDIFERGEDVHAETAVGRLRHAAGRDHGRRCARRPRWSTTGSSTASPPTGSPTGCGSRRRRRRSSSTATWSASRRSRASSPTRSSRPRSTATSRRCSAAAARSPRSARATGRRASSASGSRSTRSSRAPPPTSSRSRWSAATTRSPRPGLATRMIMQIHDELLFEGPEDEAERAAEIVSAEMVGAADLDPPLAVDAGRRAELAGREVTTAEAAPAPGVARRERRSCCSPRCCSPPSRCARSSSARARSSPTSRTTSTSRTRSPGSSARSRCSAWACSRRSPGLVVGALGAARGDGRLPAGDRGVRARPRRRAGHRRAARAHAADRDRDGDRRDAAAGRGQAALRAPARRSRAGSASPASTSARRSRRRSPCRSRRRGGGWRGALAAFSLATLAICAGWLALSRGAWSERSAARPPRLPVRRPIVWVIVLAFALPSAVYYGLVAWIADVYRRARLERRERGRRARRDGRRRRCRPALVVPWLADRMGSRRGWMWFAAGCLCAGDVRLRRDPRRRVRLGGVRRHRARHRVPDLADDVPRRRARSRPRRARPRR